MTRELSNLTRRAMYAQDTEEVYLPLLTIEEQSLAAPIRVVYNTENVESRGETYVAYQFDLTLPTDEEESPPAARLTIDNVSKDIADALRAMTEPATFTIEVIRASAPDDVEISWTSFKLTNVQGDVFQISGDLTLEDVTTEPYPYLTFNPKAFRGLFK